MNYTCMFPEEKCCGMWRLQTDEPALIERLQHRTYQKDSKWSVTGRGDIWIFRKSFPSSAKAKESLNRTLMQMDENPFELKPLQGWKGWEVIRLAK